MGRLDELVEILEGVPGEPKFVHVEHDAALVQDPEDDRFPVNRRDGGDPEVNLLPFHPEHDPPVLREAPLGDVQLGHDFEPGDDRRLEAFRGRFHVVQHAVDPVPHPEMILERFQVNVRGPPFDGPGDDQVHETDDRTFGGHVPQLIHVLFIPGLVFRDAVDILDDLLHGRSARAVGALHRLEDL